MTAVLSLDNVTAGYLRQVLKDFSLAVEPGEVYGLLGRNGAGKTTVMRLLLGLLKPQAGKVRILGEDPTDASTSTQRRFTFIGEDLELPVHLRIADVFSLYRQLYGRWKDDTARAMVELLELSCDSTLDSLSFGQLRQALLIAQIAVEPRLLLLDEPTRGLDPVARREFVSLLVEVLGNGTTSILLASNTLSDVERLAERVGFLHHGRIIFEGRKEDLVDQVLLVVFAREHTATLRASKHPRLLRAWEENGECRALIHAADGNPEDDIAALEAGAPLSTRRLPLEEMFIALLG